MEKTIRKLVLEAVGDSFRRNSWDMDSRPTYFERPREKVWGDWSLSCALKLAKTAKTAPLRIAEVLAADVRQALAAQGLTPAFSAIEVSPPGFINFTLAPAALQAVLTEISAERDDYGRVAVGNGARVLLEFVSANPTGPLSIAHARQAAVGDTLANILSFAGFVVHREYYLNDDGNQIRNLGLSLQARYRQARGVECALPVDGYQGQYVCELAAELIPNIDAAQAGEPSLDWFCQQAVDAITAIIKQELFDFGVSFDAWLSQKQTMTPERVAQTITRLRQAGYVYEQEGATWFQSTAFGDDKDRVLIKSDGAYTYVAPDIAYHEHKFERGFDRLIDIFGPDHHGYVRRLKAAVGALGYQPEQLDVLIIQLATLFRDGKPVVMSTRAGEYVSLRELLTDVGADVARFFFLMRRCDSLLEFDVELAKQQSAENPVYYVQYAYARAQGVKRVWQQRGYEVTRSADLTLLSDAAELAVMRHLLMFPDVIEACVRQLDPHALSVYLRELARGYHYFYDTVRILDLENNPGLSQARYVVSDCVGQVLKTGLRLCGVAVPEQGM